MLSLITCLLVFGTATLASVEGEKYHYQIKTFSVPLDHFGYTTNATFGLRYLVNETYDEDGTGPIFFYCGNEGDIELFAQNSGFMWELAPTLGAKLIFAEHRFYGKTLPFGNRSYESPAHLGYLSSEQALADYADLLTELNPKMRPVIAFGGSYGGMLAAWFRMKYPHLITGALAASAPILQFEKSCDLYNRILTSIYSSALSDKERHGKNCSLNIRKTWNLLKTTASSEGGRIKLSQKFKFCKNYTKSEDLYDIFYDYLNDVLSNLAMANYPYPNTFLAPLPAYPVRQFCSPLNQSLDGDKLLDAFYNALSVYTNFTGTLKCLDIDTAFDPSMGDAGWNFQSCTEMVMPVCSNGTTDMFPPKAWDLKAFSDDCFKKFGVRPRPETPTTEYGGRRSLDTASNIIFSNGLQDPWSGGGVLRTFNDRITIVIIPEGAHHIDLRASNKDDPESVKQARELHRNRIQRWIRGE